MLRIVLRRCVPAVRRIGATPPLASRVAVSPLLALSTTVRGAGTASGKGTKREQLAEFLAEIGVTGREATTMAGQAHLQECAISTLRINYAGLFTILGVDDALKAIIKSSSLLKSPPETTSGSLKALVGVLGAEGAAEAIRKSPAVLTSPAVTVHGAHEALVGVLGAEGAAEAIRKSPTVLKSTADTVHGSLKALVDVLGAEGAAEAIRKNPAVLMSSADTVQGASEALAEHLGNQGMLQAAGNNPAVLQTHAASIHRTATAVKGLLGDSHGTDLLKEKPRLFRASAPYIEGNFELLCDAFDQDMVRKAVRVRPCLLYDRTVAQKTVASGKLAKIELSSEEAVCRSV